MVDRFYIGSDFTSRTGFDSIREEIREGCRVLESAFTQYDTGYCTPICVSYSGYKYKRYGTYRNRLRSMGCMRDALFQPKRGFQPGSVSILDMIAEVVPVCDPIEELYRATCTEEE